MRVYTIRPCCQLKASRLAVCIYTDMIYFSFRSGGIDNFILAARDEFEFFQLFHVIRNTLSDGISLFDYSWVVLFTLMKFDLVKEYDHFRKKF